MNEADLRASILLKVAESQAPDDFWPERDRNRVTRLALERIGRQPHAEQAFIATRAQLARPDLLARDPQAARAFRHLSWHPWIGPVVIGAAALLGGLTDMLSNSRQINLLAPPVIGLLIWNLALFAAMAVRGLFASARAPAHAALGPIGSAIAWIGRGPAPKLTGRLSAFAEQWTLASQPLMVARVASVMHWAAFALAAGAVAAMYGRGIAFEFNAGWESTFLDAGQVSQLLHWVLGPASLMTGLALPDEPGFAALAFSAGPGENAARWIHLWATTIALFILLPRALLGIVCALRARRLSRNLPYDFSQPYFEGLSRLLRGDPARLLVFPYGTRVVPEAEQSLQTTFRRLLGSNSEVVFRPTVAFGDEDQFKVAQADQQAPLVGLLFSLNATPERENQGQFVAQAAEQWPAQTRLMVIIDEAAFISRFPNNSDRLEQRRASWQKVMGGIGQEPIFVRLRTDQIEYNLDALRAAHPGSVLGSDSVREMPAPELVSR